MKEYAVGWKDGPRNGLIDPNGPCQEFLFPSVHSESCLKFVRKSHASGDDEQMSLTSRCCLHPLGDLNARPFCERGHPYLSQ